MTKQNFTKRPLRSTIAVVGLAISLVFLAGYATSKLASGLSRLSPDSLFAGTDNYQPAAGVTVVGLTQKNLQNQTTFANVFSLGPLVEHIIKDEWPSLNNTEVAAIKIRALGTIGQQVDFPTAPDPDLTRAVSSSITGAASDVLPPPRQTGKIVIFANKTKYIVPGIWVFVAFMMLLVTVFWVPKSPQDEVKREKQINSLGILGFIVVIAVIGYYFRNTITPPVGYKAYQIIGVLKYYAVDTLPLSIMIVLWYWFLGFLIIMAIFSLYAWYGHYPEVFAVSRRFGNSPIGPKKFRLGFMVGLCDLAGDKIHSTQVLNIIEKVVGIMNNLFKMTAVVP